MIPLYPVSSYLCPNVVIVMYNLVYALRFQIQDDCAPCPNQQTDRRSLQEHIPAVTVVSSSSESTRMFGLQGLVNQTF